MRDVSHGRRSIISNVRRLIVLGFLIPFLAGQSAPGREKRPECTKDLMFVFDASGSMATTDLTARVAHIERVKNAFRRIVREIPETRRMGLIVYGQGAYNQCDSIELKLRPTINAGPILMAEIEKITPAGRTPLTQAVHDAAEVLGYRQNPAVIVLLTDGEETCGGKPCDMAQALKSAAADLTIHVIGYRHREAGGLGAVFGARCLAEETGGLYLPVETEDQIVDALRKTLTCPLTTDNLKGLPRPLMKAELSSPSP
ncbi:vWA domain-containing protein [Hyphomicrobium sp.]|jgi:Ca-activated chloride channel family protein|uniref:vWA domain-containing protein n=1 Tax=Hyphomicrobium sp. TaxID=82 RepID=UPI002D1B4783|nr:VWA domain-containing protein [Hyphomicrobium sp.]HVZ05787.1 VWA domain-containing protein [Hyphomicrobium sp.]